MIGRRWALGVLTVVVLTACGDAAPGTIVAPSSTPTTTSAPVGSTAPSDASTSASPTASCTPAFAATAAIDTETEAGGILGLKAVGSGVHPGYDRVVFTFGGSGQPGWRAEYVGAPTSEGSGNPVAVAGGQSLQLALRAVGYPGDTGVAEPATKRFSPVGTKVVREVVLDSVYEGQYTAFIGVDTSRPFRVFRLAAPPRVVVDVRHC